MPSRAGPSNSDYARGLARAFGGSVIFAFPLLMTMEMWWAGFAMAPHRLWLFLALGGPLLFGLSHFAGFRETYNWADDVLDALAAYAVGVVASAALLGLFSILEPGMPARELVGKVAVQALPAAIGALIARQQLKAGGGGDDDDNDRAGYLGQLFLMMVGALVLALNVAPTEEMALIAYRMSVWHVAALAVVSVVSLHLLVYSVGFAGQEEGHPEGPLRTFAHFTLAGYAIALLLSLYVLWTFGRADGASMGELMKSAVVLGFPASLGAAAARLLV